MRLEKDSLGELEVPDEAYYGVQTVRCSGNYKIGNHTYNEFPEVIRAMAEIKKACAITNSEIGACLSVIFLSLTRMKRADEASSSTISF